jgi:gluconolactonase
MRPFFAFFLGLLAASPLAAQQTREYKTTGKITISDPALRNLIDETAPIEIISEGYNWSEGPLWVQDSTATGGGFLIWSDVPENRIFKWVEGQDTTPVVYMEHSGYTGLGTYSRERGSNGLNIDKAGNLYMAEHGDRRISVMKPGAGKKTVADSYQGKRFNSPNDIDIASNGNIYITDPSFGLPQNPAAKELAFNGVYLIRPTGEVVLLTDEFEAPNGVGLSPDEKTLYIADTSFRQPVWKAFDIQNDGTIANGRVLFNAREAGLTGAGGPDGLEVSADGTIWSSGPGGVVIISPEGKLLGRIEPQTNQNLSNAAFGGADGSYLFMTNDSYILRVKTKTKGMRWKP